jgi:glycosyltransferase involved in cell wall biosynthesis
VSPVEISVVIPVHNEAPRLAACLDSLLSQRFPEDAFEILVVDNASTDASGAVAARYPRVRVLEEARRGAYVARNRGVAASRGAVVAFIDPDCVAAPDWLEKISAAMREPGAALVQGYRRAAVEALPVRLLADYENAKAAYILGTGLEELYFGYTNNMAARRELFEQIGPFVEVPRGADTIFVRRVVKARSAGVVRYVPDMVVTHGELDSVAGYFRKVYLYGRHRVLTEPIEAIRPLGMKERLGALRCAARDGSYPLWKSALLAFLLSGGLLAWRLGGAFTVRPPRARRATAP